MYSLTEIIYTSNPNTFSIFEESLDFVTDLNRQTR
jgi:hypothetical protein